MTANTKIALVVLGLALLAIPTCLALRTPPPSHARATPAPAQAAPPVPESLPMAPEDIPAASADIPAAPTEQVGPLKTISQAVDRVIPNWPRTAEQDLDDPHDPIGNTIRAMHRHLQATPDALAERPAVKRPGVVYWLDSNLIASDP